MKIILKNNECKNIKVHYYPDGQKNVTIDLDKFNVKEQIRIDCSIHNFSQLEVLLCIVAAFKKHDFIIDKIHFVYLFGMRSDRSFEPGMSNYFRDVLAPIINSMDIKFITLLYPHSQLSYLHLNHRFIDNEIPINKELCKLKDSSINLGGDESFAENNWDKVDGSFHKVRGLHGIQVILTDRILTFIEEQKNKSIIIWDDLCDGGATFIAESIYLKAKFPDRKIYLFVIHGLFTHGVEYVAEHFEHIFTTNSYQDIFHSKVTQIKVI